METPETCSVSAFLGFQRAEQYELHTEYYVSDGLSELEVADDGIFKVLGDCQVFLVVNDCSRDGDVEKVVKFLVQAML